VDELAYSADEHAWIILAAERLQVKAAASARQPQEGHQVTGDTAPAPDPHRRAQGRRQS
jgi:hypothetical protein